jgi:hypothetical protein
MVSGHAVMIYADAVSESDEPGFLVFDNLLEGVAKRRLDPVARFPMEVVESYETVNLGKTKP